MSEKENSSNGIVRFCPFCGQKNRLADVSQLASAVCGACGKPLSGDDAVEAVVPSQSRRAGGARSTPPGLLPRLALSLGASIHRVGAAIKAVFRKAFATRNAMIVSFALIIAAIAVPGWFIYEDIQYQQQLKEQRQKAAAKRAEDRRKAAAKKEADKARKAAQARRLEAKRKADAKARKAAEARRKANRPKVTSGVDITRLSSWQQDQYFNSFAGNERFLKKCLSNYQSRDRVEWIRVTSYEYDKYGYYFIGRAKIKNGGVTIFVGPHRYGRYEMRIYKEKHNRISCGSMKYLGK